jgi:S-DNA-T family DNA segregation ATPase FtsK/SpoIIIE
MAKRRKKKGEGRLTGAGLFLLVAGLLSFVSLVVYLGQGALETLGGVTSGFVGELGLRWGRAQVWLYGYLSLALALVVAYVGVEFLRGAWEKLGRRILGFLLLVTSLAVLFGLTGLDDPGAPWHGSGGWIGVGLAEGLLGAVGSLGTVVLSLAALVLGFTLATGVRPATIGAAMGRGGRWVAERFKRLLKGRRVSRGRTRGGAVRKAAVVEPEPTASPTVETEHVEAPSERAVEEVPAAEPPEWQQPGESVVPEPPPLDLLGPLEVEARPDDPEERRARVHALTDFLEHNQMAANVVEYAEGPSLGRFELRLAPGVRIAALERLKPEVALALGRHQVRFVPNPERGTVVLEVPLTRRRVVRLRELLEEPDWQEHESPLAFPVGLTQDGKTVVADLTQMPHLLVAGTTGSGKSVFLNALLLSLLCRVGPRHLRLVLIDPGRVELVPYSGLPHLLTEPVRDPYAVLAVLGRLVDEMDQRYERLSQARSRSIATFNASVAERGDVPMPYIVVAVDELAELMAATGRAVEGPLARVAQMSRAVGIHLVVATQRPSVDVVTGVMKANFPSRIAFKVRSKTDSRVILDQGGAEELAGGGDLLFLPVGATEPLRLQGAFAGENDVAAVVDYWSGTAPGGRA